MAILNGQGRDEYQEMCWIGNLILQQTLILRCGKWRLLRVNYCRSYGIQTFEEIMPRRYM
jgi:hypothetical protein